MNNCYIMESTRQIFRLYIINSLNRICHCHAFSSLSLHHSTVSWYSSISLATFVSLSSTHHLTSAFLYALSFTDQFKLPSTWRKHLKIDTSSLVLSHTHTHAPPSKTVLLNFSNSTCPKIWRSSSNQAIPAKRTGTEQTHCQWRDQWPFDRGRGLQDASRFGWKLW